MRQEFAVMSVELMCFRLHFALAGRHETFSSELLFVA